MRPINCGFRPSHGCFNLEVLTPRKTGREQPDTFLLQQITYVTWNLCCYHGKLDFVDSIFFLSTTFSIHLARKTYLFTVFGFLELFNFSFFVLRTKSNRRLLKTMAIFLNFVVKTALIWLVLGGFFCVFSPSETICNLHSCYKFCTHVTEELHSFLSQSEMSNFFVYIITNTLSTQDT